MKKPSVRKNEKNFICLSPYPFVASASQTSQFIAPTSQTTIHFPEKLE
jgi:hypothetical protein